MTRRVSAWFACVLLASITGLGSPASAQQEPDAESCQLVRSTLAERQADILYVTGPMLVRCDDGVEVRADSAVYYQARAEVELYRNVRYLDAEREITSDRGDYQSATGRVHATGDVLFTDRSDGTTLRGPELEYFRPMENRPDPRVVATGRPRLVTPAQGEGAEPGDSLVVDADDLNIVAQERMTAVGDVVIRRPDVTATGARAFYDSGRGYLEMESGNGADLARVEGERFTLVGERIEAMLPEDRMERVMARRNAELTSEEMNVTAAELDLFFADDLLRRLAARISPNVDGNGVVGRPVVRAESFRLEGDTVDAVMPGQVLRHVLAVGTPYAETLDPDTAGGEAEVDPDALEIGAEPGNGLSVRTDRDWLRGDTINAYFRTVREPATADTADPVTLDTADDDADTDEERVELDRLVAVRNARSLFRAREEENGELDEDAEQANDRPSLNYVAGSRIELRMLNGELEVARVQGLRRGVFLDASGDVAQAPEDGEATPGIEVVPEEAVEPETGEGPP